MSVYGAMNAAVSGMKAQSKSLGNISDNIANSQTVGFKRIDTNFADLVTVSNRSAHSPGGVIATPRYRHSVEGPVNQTQIGTNMAIAGSGFFVVSKASSVTPQGVDIKDDLLYTRRGDFEIDRFGFMKNGSNYYLRGRPVIDQQTLNVSDLMQPVRIQKDVMQAQTSSRIKYNVNLPANSADFQPRHSLDIQTTQNAAPVRQVNNLSFPAANITNATAYAFDINGTPVNFTYTGVNGDTTAFLDAFAAALNAAGAVDANGDQITAARNGTTLTVTGGAGGASATFTIPAAAPPHNALLTNTASQLPADGSPQISSLTFGGTPVTGDTVALNIGGTPFTTTYTGATGDMPAFLAFVAAQINLAGLVDGSGEALNESIGATVVGNTISLRGGNGNSFAVSASGDGWQTPWSPSLAADMANADDTLLYQAAGSFSGGAVTVFNDLGAPVDVQFRWIKMPTGTNQWQLIAKDPNDTVSPWQTVGTTTFTDGQPDVNPLTMALALTGFNAPVTIDFTSDGESGIDQTGQNGITAFYDEDISIYRLDQDGYGAGILSDVFVNEFGYVVANYDNGRSKVLYQVPLATFNAPNELQRLDGGAFNRTPESGDPLYAENGNAGAGEIIASAVEGSNVDIADEFTKMIVTQRAYSANSRTVRTADEMLEEVVNLKR